MAKNREALARKKEVNEVTIETSRSMGIRQVGKRIKPPESVTNPF
jgi:hypothetical protein